MLVSDPHASVGCRAVFDVGLSHRCLTSADQSNDFNAVRFNESMLLVLVSRYQLEIHLNRDFSTRNLQIAEQIS